MAEGLSNRMIAEELDISPRTVELHRSNLLSKMGARHSAEAIRVAIEALLPEF
jgi:two-component system, LuxR family, response regulator FixJ